MRADRSLGLRWLRDSWPQRRVWTAAVVMSNELLDDHPQMTFVEGDQEIEALATNRPDQALAMGVCFRRSNGRLQNAETKTLQFGIQFGREDRIAVMDHELVRMVEGQALAELLEGSLGNRMRGDVRVQNPPRTDLHGDEDVQRTQRRGHRNHEVTSDDALGVVSHEGGPLLIPPPAVRRRRIHVLAYGAR